ncbi:MAG: hypothetical protein U5R14_08725 [Gemmatimonadota bacterium]|nr:hypothetical protein [Gemmatimonadota bacterium]
MISNARFRWTRSVALLTAFGATLVAAPAVAQVTGDYDTERVSYVNPRDGTELSAGLTVPPGQGPHPAVVLTSVAGTDPAIERLVAEGYAVLTPELRGFAAVEPLLRATFSDLARDLAAAFTYLSSLAVIDADALALVAQGDNAPPAMLHAVDAERAIPLVLMAPPAYPGVEAFRLEQRWIAERQGADPSDIEALDAYVREIADVALNVEGPYERRSRLEGVRARSSVELPRNASFPADERQMRFFASRFWHDKLAFDPGSTLARLRSPALVLIGTEDPNTRLEDYLEVVRQGLASAETADGTVCVVPGRTRHVFSDAALEILVTWLSAHVKSARGDDGTRGGRTAGCLDHDGR